jgi:hypothetical protein
MSDPQPDWLSEELKALPELEAPDAIVPKVLAAVRQQEARGWVRRAAFGSARTVALGFALAVVVWLSVFNPVHFAGEALDGSPVWKVLELLATAIRLSLFQAKVYHFSLILVLSALGIVSYLLCLAAATVVHRLSRAES